MMSDMNQNLRTLRTLFIVFVVVTLFLSFYVSLRQSYTSETFFFLPITTVQLYTQDFRSSREDVTTTQSSARRNKPVLYKRLEHTGRTTDTSNPVKITTKDTLQHSRTVFNAIVEKMKTQPLNSSVGTSVLVLTYMRSGSSLTGDILQHAPNTFYVFEPFRSLYNTLKGKPITYINGTVRLPSEYRVADIHKQALQGWMTCNFSQIYSEVFKDEFMAYGNKSKALLECLSNKKITTDGSKHCIEHFRLDCMKSASRILKTIRTPMSLALSTLNQVENMKIIHLVRDPRATLRSQTERGKCPVKAGGVVGCAKLHCASVWDDTSAKQRSTFDSERVLTIKYEDIALKPIETAKRMYSFVGLPFDSDTEKYVYGVTLGGNISDCKVCQLKWQIGSSSDTSKDHIDSWKSSKSLSWVKSVQNACSTVMRHYKYEIIE